MTGRQFQGQIHPGDLNVMARTSDDYKGKEPIESLPLPQ